MKRSALFDEFLAKVDYATKREVDFNSDIAYRIDCILKKQGITQRDLAKRMGKKESEISRWISGRHGFKTSTIAKLEAALGEHLIEVTQEDNCQVQVVSAVYTVLPNTARSRSYINKERQYSIRF